MVLFGCFWESMILGFGFTLQLAMWYFVLHLPCGPLPASFLRKVKLQRGEDRSASGSTILGWLAEQPS